MQKWPRSFSTDNTANLPLNFAPARQPPMIHNKRMRKKILQSFICLLGPVAQRILTISLLKIHCTPSKMNSNGPL